MKSNNKHRGLVLSSTFVGLVCGLVLTHQQAYAAQTPPVSNQQSQITTVSDNNMSQTAAVNPKSYSSNISYPTPVSHNVTPNTYNSPETGLAARQQIDSSDSTAAVATPSTGATVPVADETATSTNSGNNNSTNPATSSPSPDTGNSVTTPTASADNQTNDNSNTTAASSEQPETNIIAQGTWGTSKWDYTQEGDDYILHLHAGTLGTPEKYKDNNGNIWDVGIGSLNAAFEDQLTKIIIDPGVIANRYSQGLFSHLENLQTIQGLENFDTSHVTNMFGMFEFCYKLTNLNLSNFDTSQVTDMSYMFGHCYSLTNIDLNYFDSSQVTDMSGMFTFCTSLTSLDVSHFNTSQVTNMRNMFGDCDYLTNLDVTHFNTSKVTNMSGMFGDCHSLLDLDVSHFDTSQVTDMSGMFSYCSSLTNLDLSYFNTSQVTDMSGMFYWSSSLANLDLSHFDTSQVIDIHWMFDLCPSLNHLVLGTKIQLIDPNGSNSALPAVPAAGTKIPGTDRVVTAPYWVATSGYQQGKRYTSKELEQLTGRDQVTTYDWDSQPLFASTVATKAVIRTINVHNPDGTMQTENQIATLTQEIKNNADGTQTWGPWSTGQWQAYAVPEITGYTADPTEVAAQTVTDSTVNQTIDVYYEPVVQQITVNYLENGKIVGTQILTGYAGETIIPQYRAPKGYEIIDRPQGELTFSTDKQQIVQIPVQAQIIPTSESKVLIRTVNIHLPSGNLKTYRQPVVLTRTVYLNAVSGEKTYDDWSTGHWGAITVPVVAGYTASQAQVAAQTVTAQDSDQLLDIYYTKA